jgi:hypothetical protein
VREADFGRLVRLRAKLSDGERTRIAERLLAGADADDGSAVNSVAAHRLWTAARTLSLTDRLELADQLIPPVIPSDPAAFRMWYQDLSGQVGREDGLVDQRLRWLMTFEGLLFTGLSLMTKNASPFILATMGVFALAGILAALIARNALRAAYGSLDDLKALYFKVPPAKRQELIRPFGGPVWHRHGKLLASHLPDVVLVTWVILIVLGIVFRTDILHPPGPSIGP